MTTSQIQRRLVDFDFYHMQPPHPPHGQALFTSLSPCHSLTHLLSLFFNLKHTHTHTHTHRVHHTLLFCLLRPDSGCQRRNDKSNYFGVISMGDTHTHTHTNTHTHT
ncbi:hypothetical protein ABVT39_009358 [Epinephelus coioides]